jgi:hypothetical protein
MAQQNHSLAGVSSRHQLGGAGTPSRFGGVGRVVDGLCSHGLWAAGAYTNHNAHPYPRPSSV